jgi:hypothetical protein
MNTKEKYIQQIKLGNVLNGTAVLDSTVNFFAEELVRISPSVYEKTYEDSLCEKVLPQLVESNSFDEDVRLTILDHTGSYTVSKSLADNVATVKTSRGKIDLPALTIQSAAKYNIAEIDRMAKLGMSISDKQLMACAEQWKLAKEDSAFVGINKPEGSTNGLFYYLDPLSGDHQIEEGENPADGTGSSTYFQDKTSTKIRKVLVNAIERAKNTYKKREWMNGLMMLLPSRINTLITEIPWDDNNSSTTLKKWLLETYARYNLQIEDLPELDAVTTSEGTDSYGIIYPMRDDIICQVTTHAFQIGALFQKHFEFEQQTMGRLAGVAVREPKACTFIKGISEPVA